MGEGKGGGGGGGGEGVSIVIQFSPTLYLNLNFFSSLALRTHKYNDI